MATLILSNLVRTMQSYFRIGAVRITDNSGVVEAKDSAGTSYAAVKATQVRFSGANASNYVGLTAPSGLGASPLFVLPSADGATGQFLKTDGALNLSFASAMAYAEQMVDTSFTEATSSPLTVFTPAANATLTRVQVTISAAAAGGSPTLSVGVVGTVERDMAATECDLKTVGCYEVCPNTDVTGTPGTVIATITPSAQTFTGIIRIWYVNPL